MKKTAVIILVLILAGILIISSRDKVTASLNSEEIKTVESQESYCLYNSTGNNILIWERKTNMSIDEAYSAIKENKFLTHSLRNVLKKHYGINTDKKFSISNYSYYTATQDYINALVFKGCWNNDKDYSMSLFRNNEYLYYILVDTESTEKFYTYLDNIDIKNFNGAPSNDIVNDIAIRANGDLGKDENDKTYTSIVRVANNIARASSEVECDNSIEIKVLYGSHLQALKKTTIDVFSSFNGKEYKPHGYVYNTLKPREICEYNLLLPIDTKDKTSIFKIIENMSIYLEYEEEGIKKKLQIR